MGRRFKKGTMTSPSTSVWEMDASLAFILMPDNSVLWMSQMSLKQLPQHWSSEWQSLSKFICKPFKKNIWDSRAPLSHSDTIPTGFYSQKLWGYRFIALKPWAERPSVGLGPSFLRRTFTKEIYLPIFLSTTHVYWTSSFYISTPPTILMWLLCILSWLLFG